MVEIPLRHSGMVVDGLDDECLHELRVRQLTVGQIRKYLSVQQLR